jgi:hypothetical protein
MKRDVTMVTVSVNALKQAFRKTFPDKTSSELVVPWTNFWANVVLTAEKVERVAPKADFETVPPAE